MQAPTGFENRYCPICYFEGIKKEKAKFRNFTLLYCLEHHQERMQEAKELYIKIMEGR